MNNEIPKQELLKLLIAERDHHFNHPHEVGRRFLYSMGATASAILAGLLIKKEDLIKILDSMSSVGEFMCIGLFVFFFTLGYGLILLGLKEHTNLHSNQRRVIEYAIKYLLNQKSGEYELSEFMEKFGSNALEYRKGKKANELTFLFATEPDTRSGLAFHDGKIESGILIIILGIAVLFVGQYFM